MYESREIAVLVSAFGITDNLLSFYYIPYYLLLLRLNERALNWRYSVTGPKASPNGVSNAEKM